MILLDNAAMRSADEYTMTRKDNPLSEETLIERAGSALYVRAIAALRQGSALVVCGKGNNGADGLVCAQKLRKKGCFVQVVVLAEKGSLQGEVARLCREYETLLEEEFVKQVREKYVEKANPFEEVYNGLIKREVSAYKGEVADAKWVADGGVLKRPARPKTPEEIEAEEKAKKAAAEAKRRREEEIAYLMQKAEKAVERLVEEEYTSFLPEDCFSGDAEKKRKACTAFFKKAFAKFFLEEEERKALLAGIDPVKLVDDFVGAMQNKTLLRSFAGGVRNEQILYNEWPADKYTVLLDCVYGTGYKPRQKEAAFDKINEYREKGAYVISADVPSGLSDNGEVAFGSVVADETLCFGYQKLSTVLQDGLDVCGKVLVADVGIERQEGHTPTAILVEERAVRSWLPIRARNTHKGNYGKAAIVGGSSQYTGAAGLALSACVRGGVGYTTLYAPDEVLPAFYLKTPEALLRGYEGMLEADSPLWQDNAVGFGVGAGLDGATAKILRTLIKKYEGKLVVDADGLNALASLGKESAKALLAVKKCQVILTPHVKEFARLTGYSVAEIKKNSLATAKEYAKENGVVLLLKGCSTIVTDGETSYIVTAGCAGQAKGGSGDVLTGLLTSLLATGLSPLEGAATAAYIAGKSAEIAAKERGETGLTATDVVDSLGRVFASLQR